MSEGQKRKRADGDSGEPPKKRTKAGGEAKEGASIPMHRRQNSKYLGKHTDMFQNKTGVLVCCAQGKDAQAVMEAKNLLEAASHGALTFRPINTGCAGILFLAASPASSGAAKDTPIAAADGAESETKEAPSEASAASPLETMDVLVERLMKGFHASAAAAASAPGDSSSAPPSPALPRYCLRFLPVLASCKTEMDDIREHARAMLDTHFSRVASAAMASPAATTSFPSSSPSASSSSSSSTSTPSASAPDEAKEGKVTTAEEKEGGEGKASSPVEFAVVYRSTNNKQLKKAEVIGLLAETVTAAAPNTKVNLTAPKVSLLAWVLRSAVVLGLAANYKETRYTLVPPHPPKKKEKPAASSE